MNAHVICFGKYIHHSSGNVHIAILSYWYLPIVDQLGQRRCWILCRFNFSKNIP